MAITREQALTLDTFHYPAGGSADADKCSIWRRNGKTQTWVTRPTHYRIPVKYGLYDFGNIFAAEMEMGTRANGSTVYAPKDCPVCFGSKS